MDTYYYMSPLGDLFTLGNLAASAVDLWPELLPGASLAGPTPLESSSTTRQSASSTPTAAAFFLPTPYSTLLTRLAPFNFPLPVSSPRRCHRRAPLSPVCTRASSPLLPFSHRCQPAVPRHCLPPSSSSPSAGDGRIGPRINAPV